LWCVDRDGDETAVKVKTKLEMPKIGDEAHGKWLEQCICLWPY
jgi:hypothetical protein